MEVGDIAQKPYNRGMLLAEKCPSENIPYLSYSYSEYVAVCCLLNVTFCQVELTLREEMFGSRYSYISTYLAIRFCMVSLESVCLPVAMISRLSSSPGSGGLKLHLSVLQINPQLECLLQLQP